MFELTVCRSFSAAHTIKDKDGADEPLHGHNFSVEISVTANETNNDGIAVDFRELKRWTDQTLKGFDHHYLNNIEEFAGAIPSAENIARIIFEQIKPKATAAGVSISRVTIWEEEDGRVSYSND
jgi:6-pyruvoyltetrahydropterin/6-carboxytetrahydropterin synthase